MNCTPHIIESGEFKDCYDAQDSGLVDVASIWLPEDIETYPNFFSPDNTVGLTKMQALNRVAAAITMKANKFPYKLPCIFEKNSYEIVQVGNSLETRVKITIQNTEHNRGFVSQMLGRRFILGVTENDGDTLLVGRSNGTTNGYLATIQKDSARFLSGDTIQSDRMGEFTVVAKKFLPAVYTYAIAYS